MIKFNVFFFGSSSLSIMVSKENKHYEDAIHCEDVCIFRFESGFLKQRIHDLEDASLPSQDFLVFNNIDSFFLH